MPEAAKADGNLHVHPCHAGVGIGSESADNDDPPTFHLAGSVLYEAATSICDNDFSPDAQLSSSLILSNESGALGRGGQTESGKARQTGHGDAVAR